MTTPVNPVNDRPAVQLLDQAGVSLRLISQREAARLLRAGMGDLLLQVPPAMRLCVAAEEYEEFISVGPDDPVLKARFLHARRSVLYGNVHFQGPGGEMMFHGDSEKALWYLNRGLVEVVSQSPPILRFQFSPGGRGHAGDDYYLTGKVNRCVVCGETEGLNRHHVVPSVYRRHLPAEVKDHSHHDVLLLCLECHERYEAAADELKGDLGEQFGVPLHGLRCQDEDPARRQAIKAAVALTRHGEHMPAARKEELLAVVGAWLERTPSTADVEEVAALMMGSGGERIEHGSHVVANTADIQGFIQRWREHFVMTMQPEYLPEHWDVARPAARGRMEADQEPTTSES